MSKKIHKIIGVQVICLMIVFVFAKIAWASYRDVETLVNNSMTAGSLDAEVTSAEGGLQESTVAEKMLPGNRVSRTGAIKNVGSSDFQYKVSFEKISGDDGLCNALKLEAKKDGVVAYSGSLASLDVNVDNLTPAESDDWNFVVSLNDNVVSDINCEFAFKFTAWQTDFAEPIQGWVDVEKIENNLIHTGLETPRQTGYNENDENDSNSYSIPRNPNELSCTGDVTNINGISVHWTDVAHGNSRVKYQRQYNKVGHYGWSGNEIYINPYTNYRTFGGNPGSEGVYGSRVRAWVDTNNNNVIDNDEMVSDWSNECYIEFDRTAPATPTGLRRLKREDHSVVYECGDVIPIQHVQPDWDDNTEPDFDHYEYTSFNAPNGSIGINELVLHDSIFAYNGPWLPHEGTYGFAVRAVDKAGNKSDWALSGKSLAGSCQITYDNSGPELTIDSIEYPNGTIEPDKFVTNYNQPVIHGTVNDVAGIKSGSVRLFVGGHEYIATVHGNQWKAHIRSVLSDGIHTLKVEAQDSLGHLSTVQRDIHIDTKVPNAEHTYYKDGRKIEGFHTYYEHGHKFTGPVVHIDGDLSRLSFTGEYSDFNSSTEPSAGLYWDSYAIFQAQDDGSFRFSHDGKKAFCGWRREPNLVDISDEATFSLTEQKSFADCVATLPPGEYYIAHHIYDYATRKDIPSINQFRDVLGLHFVVDSAMRTPEKPLEAPDKSVDEKGEGVVLNEFMPMPAIGDEWVELYNNGEKSVDVAGWFIASDDKHKKEIDKKHTKNGSTLIKPKEFLVITYKDLDLSDKDGEISLLNTDGVVVDYYRYKAKEVSVGKTIARIPDGVGKWADPVPTPGEKNNPSNKKEDFRKYYEQRCFDGEKLLCNKDFAYKIGLLNDSDSKDTTKKILTDKDTGVIVDANQNKEKEPGDKESDDTTEKNNINNENIKDDKNDKKDNIPVDLNVVNDNKDEKVNKGRNGEECKKDCKESELAKQAEQDGGKEESENNKTIESVKETKNSQKNIGGAQKSKESKDKIKQDKSKDEVKNNEDKKSKKDEKNKKTQKLDKETAKDDLKEDVKNDKKASESDSEEATHIFMLDTTKLFPWLRKYWWC